MRVVRTEGALAAPRFASTLVAIVAALASPAVARAHGGIPHPENVLVDPAHPDRLVVAATFGLVVTTDGGTTWSWTCQESVPGATAGIVSPGLLSGDETVLIAGMFGLGRGTRDGCAWEYDPLLRDRYVADVTRAPDGTIVAVTGDSGAGGMPNYLYASTDEGATFAQIGDVLPDLFLAERARFAPSDGTRVYVSGQAFISGSTLAQGFLLRSDTGGTLWGAHDVMLVDDERVLRLLAVDPSDPDTAWMVAQGPMQDRLLVTHDAGETIEEVTRLEALAMPYFRPFAFALAPDGRAWFGNGRSGLWILGTDGTPALIDKDLYLSCVVPNGDQMLLCGNGTDDGFAVGTTPAIGDYAPTPVLQYADIQRRHCDSDVDCTCDRWWPDLLREVGRGDELPDGGVDAGACTIGGDAGASDVDGGDAMDAGTTGGGDASTPPGGGAGGGCACAASGATGGGRGAGAAIAAGIVGLALGMRRRMRG